MHCLAHYMILMQSIARPEITVGRSPFFSLYCIEKSGDLFALSLHKTYVTSPGPLQENILSVSYM